MYKIQFVFGDEFNRIQSGQFATKSGQVRTTKSSRVTYKQIDNRSLRLPPQIDHPNSPVLELCHLQAFSREGEMPMGDDVVEGMVPGESMADMAPTPHYLPWSRPHPSQAQNILYEILL